MMMKTIMLLATLMCIIAITQTTSVQKVVSEEWEEWKLLHHKTYMTKTEEEFRMKIFMDNRENIERHNVLASRGTKSYTLEMNKFGDQLNHEVGAKNGHKTENTKQTNFGISQIIPANVELPTKVDWRNHGAVTAVKDQGHCGSCWAFSATGSLEGQHYRKTGRLVSLSEQQLLDCSFKYGNDGCNGGEEESAFVYIKENGGIDTEERYPYLSTDSFWNNGSHLGCHYNSENIGATLKGYVEITSGDEDALKAAIATVGPVSVAIDASHSNFHFYHSGVYDEPECKTKKEDLGHAVLAVGYGTDNKIGETSMDYWIVKNSWASEWGESGYIRMGRNKNNQCGIATDATYPLV